MQENEFEKQVKQKMDEFRLRPSEPVWPEIRRELLRKRRRRLLILIPLFAVLLAGGYFTWVSVFPEKQISLHAEKNVIDKNSNKKTNTATENNINGQPENKADATATPNSDVSGDKENKEKQLTKETATEEGTVSQNKKAVIVEKELLNPESVESKSSSKDYANKIPRPKKSKNNSAGPVVNDNSIAIDKRTVTNKSREKANSNIAVLNDDNNRQPVTVTSLPIDTIARNEINHIDNTPVIIYSDLRRNEIADSIFAGRLANVKLPAADNGFNQGRWKVGFTFAVGASSRTDKPLQITNSSSAEKVLSSALVSGGPSTSINGGVFVLPPSDVKPGVAFKAGFVVVKSLSKRFDISSGLLYSYTSDHIQVGKSINASASSTNYFNFDVRNQSSYANIQKSDYTNKYHFIELPVSVSYNLTRKWRAPLTWNAGVSVSRLISTNALLYDAAWGGVYYDGEKDIRKTQVSISTGFSLRFGNKNSWQWNIGPQIYVGPTKLFSNAYDENKHPVYGGLHMQVLLPSKKKSR